MVAGSRLRCCVPDDDRGSANRVPTKCQRSVASNNAQNAGRKANERVTESTERRKIPATCAADEELDLVDLVQPNDLRAVPNSCGAVRFAGWVRLAAEAGGWVCAVQRWKGGLIAISNSPNSQNSSICNFDGKWKGGESVVRGRAE